MGVASDVFFSLENFGNVLKQSAVISVLALGQLLVILTRGIDLSVGANLSLSAVVGAIVWRDHGSALLVGAGDARDRHARGADQRCHLRQGPATAPVHPDPGDAHGGERFGAVPADSKTIQGVPPFVNEIGSGRIASIPGGGPVGMVPDRHDRRGRRWRLLVWL